LFAVKVYKPNEEGDLELKKRISAEKCLEHYWQTFGMDTLRTGLQAKSGRKYNKTGKAIKCIEDNCTVMVHDARRKTCSEGCAQSRLKRQRGAVNKQHHVEKKVSVCQKCKVSFTAARADRIFCSEACRAIIHFSRNVNGVVQQFCTKESLTLPRRLRRTAKIWRKVDCKLCKALKRR